LNVLCYLGAGNFLLFHKGMARREPFVFSLSLLLLYWSNQGWGIASCTHYFFKRDSLIAFATNPPPSNVLISLDYRRCTAANQTSRRFVSFSFFPFFNTRKERQPPATEMRPGTQKVSRQPNPILGSHRCPREKKSATKSLSGPRVPQLSSGKQVRHVLKSNQGE